MGIPKFFKFLKKTYPDLILDIFEKALPQNSFVEGLYVDLNAVIHTIAKAMFRYGKESLSESDVTAQAFYRALTEDQRNLLIYQNVGTFLAYLYLRIKPLKIFMLAIDGVPPKAKMDQQRERRYGRTKGETDFWNSVVISVGTPFMEGLDTYLSKTWINQYTGIFAAGMNIIHSSHREPGEGEHKIFDQMGKDLKGKDRTRKMYGNTSIRSTPYQVIIGADSDLVILSLSKSNNIIWMRDKVDTKPSNQNTNRNNNNSKPGHDISLEGQSMLEYATLASNYPDCNLSVEDNTQRTQQAWIQLFKSAYDYINITDMRRNILDQYIAPNDITDFSFISFFVGNDFLPAIPELSTVVSMAPLYYADGDIENRFRDIYQQVNLPSNDKRDRRDNNNSFKGRGEVQNPPGTKTKSLKHLSRERVNEFNANRFWDDFRDAEPTWTREDGSINFNRARGIWNEFDQREEIYPLVTEAITGTKKRKLMFKVEGGRWQTPLVDVGALKKCLKIYSNLIKEIREEKRKGKAINGSGTNGIGEEAGLDSFLVNKKNRINYVNLFRYLKTLHTYIQVFMTSEISNYEEMVRYGREVDPLIAMSLGQEVEGKKTKPDIVPAAFSGLHNIRAFGIYDSKYADPRLPKQTIDEMCRKWLEGAQWTLVYYSLRVEGTNTEWFYPYRDAPTILDLLNYLESRMVCEVAGFPGIAYNCLDDSPPTVDMIKIKDHTIYIYINSDGKQIALLKNDYTGDSKYIDIDKVEFYKKFPGQGELNLLEDEGKIPLIEISREIIKPKVIKYYPLDDDIFNLMSVENVGLDSYASTTECLFCIMPESILKTLMTPAFVDAVLGQISDAFPLTYEVITEGMHYENQTEPKIPFLSVTRVERAIELVLENYPGVFDVEVSRLNIMKKRKPLKHGNVKNVGKVAIPAPTSVPMGYTSSITGDATSAGSNIQTNAATNNRAPKTQVSILAQPQSTLNVTEKKPLWAQSPSIDQSLVNKFKASVAKTNQAKGGQNTQGQNTYTKEEAAEVERFKAQMLDFAPFVLSNLPTYLPYTGGKKPNNNVHYGQRKLLMNEVLFLLAYGNLATTVVYIGAAPGTHIPILSALFPTHIFHLWDASPFTIEGTNKINKNIQLYKRYFTDKDATNYRDNFTNKGFPILLISDIRAGKEGETAEQFEEGVRRDNQMQLNWVVTIKPIISMLKFRPPFILKKEDYNDPNKVNYQYFNGTVWLQDWAPQTSAETRLIVDTRQPIAYGIYNVIEFENRMYYFNTIIRNYAQYNEPFTLKNDKDKDRVSGLRNNYDGSYEIWIWDQFYRVIFPTSTQEQRNTAIIYTMNEVSRFLGRDLLGRDISGGISYKNRALFKAPFGPTNK